MFLRGEQKTKMGEPHGQINLGDVTLISIRQGVFYYNTQNLSKS